MSKFRSLLIATSNPGKLREVRAILAGLPLNLLTLADFPDLPAAIEDGATFEENAAKKALHYAGHAGTWTLADDSGLEVDALGGAPGVYSARYAGEGADDRANNAKLIRELSGVPVKRRTARFRCAVALASPTEVLAKAAGAFEGLIVDEPRGPNGFGYDPHFFVPECNMTSAQMSPELKNSLSHRGQALRAIQPKIVQLLESLR
ncbi:MAG: XTP/dITP diphosphatase [Planctomycetota bacterium]